MKMDITIGSRVEPERLSAHVALQLHPARFPVPWEQCGATANFAASWFLDSSAAAQRLGDDPILHSQWRGSVSYVFNELLENALKFHVGDDPIDLLLGVEEEQLVILVRNTATSEQAAALPPRVEPIVHGDPTELLIARVEANVDGDASSSGLGFLTMRTDYDVTLGWRLQTTPADDGRVWGWTSAWLPIA
ncbi:MAG: hypothetical protein CMH57_03230 [Myxococcales bacterium]|nr:hypothetical protein [Myxococcales bacterium]